MTVRYISASGTKTLTPCLICSCGLTDKGYGKVYYPPTDKVERAHRVAYVQHHGLTMADIAGVVIRHKCDNPPCINPDHLEPGTVYENVQDSIKRGRARYTKGEDQYLAKLTAEKVREIRILLKQGVSTVQLGKQFGVDRTTIRAVKSGKTWKHVP